MEIINLIFEYIPFDYVLLIGGLIVLGEMFKKFTTLPNQFLTTVLPILGATVMGIIYGTGADIFVAADFIKQLCIGLLMGWAATGGYEFFVNLIKAKKGNLTTKIIAYKEEKTIELPVEEEVEQIEIVEEKE